MPYSQNGWLGLSTSALQSKYLTSFSVAGQPFRVRKGAVATVLKYVATRFHNEVESLSAGHPRDDWSFAYRSIRGSSTVSNHASGTAIDLNATQHPLGTSPTANFTAKQRSAIRRILNDCDGVVRWGGDYSGRKDGMHFEVNAGSAAVKRLANKISSGSQGSGEEDRMEYKSKSLDGAVTLGGNWTTLQWDGTGYALIAGPAPFDVTVELVFDKAVSGAVTLLEMRPTPPLSKTLRRGVTGADADVRRLQELIGTAVDGDFGPKTEAALLDYERAHGMVVNGVVSDVQWAKLFPPEKGQEYIAEPFTNQATVVSSRGGWVDKDCQLRVRARVDGSARLTDGNFRIKYQ